MRRVSMKEREKFIAAICEEVTKLHPTTFRSEAEPLARRILRWGRTYGRLAEEACNGDWPLRHTDQAAWAKELKRQQSRATTYIAEACLELSLLVCPNSFLPMFSGDPRGHTVKLRVPSGRTDDVAGEGLCVPTS